MTDTQDASVPFGNPFLQNTDVPLLLVDRAFYMDVWRRRKPQCECCGQPLFEPRMFMFHHVLEKREKLHQHDNYTAYRHCHWNILLLCWGCHDAYERHPDTRPWIVDIKKGLLQLMEQPFSYDRDIIWLQDSPVDLKPLSLIFGNLPILIE
jgi:hypothetical protein